MEYIFYHQGLILYRKKIVFIFNIEILENVKQLRLILEHIGYYRKFIQGYALINTPMEELLKKDGMFCWDEYFQKTFELLKENKVTVPILVFPDWLKVFHAHADASCIAL